MPSEGRLPDPKPALSRSGIVMPLKRAPVASVLSVRFSQLERLRIEPFDGRRELDAGDESAVASQAAVGRIGKFRPNPTAGSAHSRARASARAAGTPGPGRRRRISRTDRPSPGKRREASPRKLASPLSTQPAGALDRPPGTATAVPRCTDWAASAGISSLIIRTLEHEPRSPAKIVAGDRTVGPDAARYGGQRQHAVPAGGHEGSLGERNDGGRGGPVGSEPNGRTFELDIESVPLVFDRGPRRSGHRSGGRYRHLSGGRRGDGDPAKRHGNPLAPDDDMPLAGIAGLVLGRGRDDLTPVGGLGRLSRAGRRRRGDDDREFSDLELGHCARAGAAGCAGRTFALGWIFCDRSSCC